MTDFLEFRVQRLQTRAPKDQTRNIKQSRPGIEKHSRASAA